MRYKIKNSNLLISYGFDLIDGHNDNNLDEYNWVKKINDNSSICLIEINDFLLLNINHCFMSKSFSNELIELYKTINELLNDGIIEEIEDDADV